VPNYQLHVYCRRNDVSQDSGIQATLAHRNDESVVLDELRKEGEWLLNFYDEVYCTVYKVEGEEKTQVDKYTLTRWRKAVAPICGYDDWNFIDKRAPDNRV
jgi:hypothetical protein